MLQEDSNGEFEIINKNNEYGANGAEKTESLSSVSSSASLLPSPGVSLSSVPSVSGNLLSNVAPPSALPSFMPTSVALPPTTAIPPSLLPPVRSSVTSSPVVSSQPVSDPYYPTQFSAAIPPSKGVQHGSGSQAVASGEDSGGLLGWMKGAVASGGILSKVASKAKNSVDSMIITLDPQMREYIYSGGDLDVLVASQQEVKISAVQEGFQTIFGRATVKGISAQATGVAAQPVGFAAGVKSAEERIKEVFKNPKIQPVPVVAIENFLLEVDEKWYDLGVLILNDPARQITLQTYTQMTPVPSTVVALAQEDTPAEYPYKETGYSVTIGSLMGRNLGVSNTEWHHALTGVSRREMILLAAKSLASLYKSSISQ